MVSVRLSDAPGENKIPINLNCRDSQVSNYCHLIEMRSTRNVILRTGRKSRLISTGMDVFAQNGH